MLTFEKGPAVTAEPVESVFLLKLLWSMTANTAFSSVIALAENTALLLVYVSLLTCRVVT